MIRNFICFICTVQVWCHTWELVLSYALCFFNSGFLNFNLSSILASTILISWLFQDLPLISYIVHLHRIHMAPFSDEFLYVEIANKVSLSDWLLTRPIVLFMVFFFQNVLTNNFTQSGDFLHSKYEKITYLAIMVFFHPYILDFNCPKMALQNF